MKKCQLMLGLFTVVFTTLEILTFTPLAAGQYGPYLGNSNANNPPTFIFSLEDGTEIYTVGNYSVGFYVGIGAPLNSMYLLGGGIYSVSYKASWEDKINVLFEWSINDPANMNDDDPNSKVEFFYAVDLSDAPEGSHKIEVFVEGGGYLYEGLGYSIYSTNGSTAFHFSVVAPQVPPTELNSTNVSSSWDVQTVIKDLGAGAYVFSSPILALDSNDMPHIAYSKLDRGDLAMRFVVYSSWNGFEWTSQTIGIGAPYSLVLDDNDTPHLLYGNILYATLCGTTLVTQTIEVVEESFCIGRTFGAIAIDSSGRLHVAYMHGKNVKHAIQLGFNWETQKVDTIDVDHDGPIQLSIALDQNDTIHILYGYPSSYEDKNSTESHSTEIIKLAVCKNSKWNFETILLPLPINGYGNMVLDSKGYPHFICSQLQLPASRPSQSNVLCVNWNGTTWNTQQVEFNVTLGIYTEVRNWINMGSLALDSHDYPKINYVIKKSGNPADSMYASWTGSSWDIQTIEITPQSDKPGVLVLDSNGNPHISYLGPRSLGYTRYQHSDVMYTTPSEANRNVSEPKQPTEPETPTTPEEPEPEPTETPLITTEAAIVITAAATAIISLTAYWFVRKRQ